MDVSTGGSPELQTLKSLEDPQRRCREPVNGTQEVMVWWDIESCPLIESCAPASLLQEIQCHLACEESRVTINVYGNGGLGSKAGLDSLIAGGITLQHRILPCKLPGSETAATKTMMVDIALWALSNPAPSTIFLISAARDTCFRDLISGLHMKDYDIHLATKFNFGAFEETPTREHLFHPMPRHWSASKQLFVVRAPVPSGDNNVQVSEALENLQLVHPRIPLTPIYTCAGVCKAQSRYFCKSYEPSLVPMMVEGVPRMVQCHSRVCGRAHAAVIATVPGVCGYSDNAHCLFSLDLHFLKVLTRRATGSGTCGSRTRVSIRYSMLPEKWSPYGEDVASQTETHEEIASRGQFGNS